MSNEELELEQKQKNDSDTKLGVKTEACSGSCPFPLQDSFRNAHRHTHPHIHDTQTEQIFQCTWLDLVTVSMHRLSSSAIKR